MDAQNSMILSNQALKELEKKHQIVLETILMLSKSGWNKNPQKKI